MTPLRTLLMASHVRYTRANGDALASALTYAVLVSLAPVVVLLAVVSSWAGSPGWLPRTLAGTAGQLLPQPVAEVVGHATRGHAAAGWIAAVMVVWAAIRVVRTARTAVRAVCGQRNGSGNPVADTLRDARLALLLYAAALTVAGALALVGPGPARLLVAPLGTLALVWLALRILPWPAAGRPSVRTTAVAAPAATAALVGLGALTAYLLDITMSGRAAIHGSAAHLVAAAVWVSVAVRVVLRAASIASAASVTSAPDVMPDAVPNLAPTPDSTAGTHPLWVIVPALDEAAGIGGTLDALAAQDDLDLTLVVCDNGSRDGTADVVRAWAAGAPFTVHVVDEAERGVGCAVDTAARYAIAHGARLLARTDADSLPRPDWVRRIRAHVADGAEMVCGASELRPDEDPSQFERHLVPRVTRATAAYGRWRPDHRTPDFRTPYVLAHGHNLAITADLYVRCGGAVRRPLEEGAEDVELLNRARRVTDRVVRAEDVVVETSLRRLRRYGARRTLLWRWDRRWVPHDADQVHVR